MSKRRPRLRTNSKDVAAAMASADSRNQVDSREAPTLRRWEAADTNRLNKAHWAKAHDQPINVDLLSDLKTLRARASYEASSNPMVAGVINTYAVDLAGENGPAFSVESDDAAYNREAEKIVRDWFTYCDLNDQLQLPDMLKQWAGLWFTKGEHLVVDANRRGATTPIAYRVLNIDPQRLDTDPKVAGDPNVALGVRRTREGRPLQYYVRDPLTYGAFTVDTTKYTPYSADELVHQFRIDEPGQVRGFPWLASSLQVIADLRDYDAQVLDAARMAADFGVTLYTEHPDSKYIEVNEAWEIERRQVSTAPPGWKPFLIDPKQPQTNYVEYRAERQREIGRPVSMPLMTVRLGSEQHNYSSARFDGQNYVRGLLSTGRWTERTSLNRMVDKVLQEASLVRNRSTGRFLLPPRPERVRLAWVWPRPPHVDPKKEAEAARVLLEWGINDLGMIAAAFGTDVETLVANHKRINKLLRDAGMPPIPFFGTGKAGNQADGGGEGNQAGDDADELAMQGAGDE